jgi:hypothetical protein
VGGEILSRDPITNWDRSSRHRGATTRRNTNAPASTTIPRKSVRKRYIHDRRRPIMHLARTISQGKKRRGRVFQVATPFEALTVRGFSPPTPRAAPT